MEPHARDECGKQDQRDTEEDDRFAPSCRHVPSSIYAVSPRTMFHKVLALLISLPRGGSVRSRHWNGTDLRQTETNAGSEAPRRALVRCDEGSASAIRNDHPY